MPFSRAALQAAVDAAARVGFVVDAIGNTDSSDNPDKTDWVEVKDGKLEEAGD